MQRLPIDPVSRRHFVKSAGAVTAAAALGGLVVPRALAHGAYAGAADKIKIGLIGCGGRGTGAAMQALAADPGVTLVAMADVFKDRLDLSYNSLKGEDMKKEHADRVQVPDDHKFVGFDSYKNVIDSDVDVVLLTSYPCFRPAHLKYAIEKGKHVFAEKPVAVDGPGIRSVLESVKAAKARNLACLVGFCWRYNAAMRPAFQQIHDGLIGDVTSAHTTYLTGTLTKHPRDPKWSDLEFQMRNWWHFTWISGDHIVEQAVHSIDRLNWLMGDRLPASVQCLGGRAARSGPEHGNVFDHFSATYEYADGTRCFHSCRQMDGSLPADNKDYIFGTKGNGVIDGWSDNKIFKSRDGKTLWSGKGTPDNAGQMYFDEHKELFASIRAGKPINDGERATNSVMTAIMARMAAYTGQTITWEQAMNSKESLVPENPSFDKPAPVAEVAIPGKTKFV